jgi:hypothetical protein
MKSLEEKQEMFDQFQNGSLITIKRAIRPSQFTTIFSKCWGYNDTMKEISFNTITKPLEQENVSFVELDLKPVASVKIYRVTIKR